MLAIGATALMILVAGEPASSSAEAETGAGAVAAASQDPGAASQDTAPPSQEDTVADSAAALDTVAGDPGEAAREATGTLRDLAITLYNALPAIGIALVLVLVAGLLARFVRVGLRAALSSWERAEAFSALAAIFIWLMALGAALSILAGDARALVGSIGLFGLALSWALQTPIESFTGWLLNSFRSYYRVGDRIAVGTVFGDVARIDFLTTTVLEAGGPDKNVTAAQSTGALITFPNSEILRSNVVNYTRDFPYVYDELTLSVANESDITVAVRLVEEVAESVVGERMADAAETYATMLERVRMDWDVATRPEVYVVARESWTDLTVRYIVPAREMRTWASRLQMALYHSLQEPGVADRVYPAYTRSQVQSVPPPRWAVDTSRGSESS